MWEWWCIWVVAWSVVLTCALLDKHEYRKTQRNEPAAVVPRPWSTDFQRQSRGRKPSQYLYFTTPYWTALSHWPGGHPGICNPSTYISVSVNKLKMHRRWWREPGWILGFQNAGSHSESLFEEKRKRGNLGLCVVHEPWLRTHDEDCIWPQMEIWEIKDIQTCLREMDKKHSVIMGHKINTKHIHCYIFPFPKFLILLVPAACSTVLPA
jgi:hypothetical protein